MPLGASGESHISSFEAGARHGRAPVAVAVPGDEADDPVVDLVDEARDPVHPVGPVRSVDRGPADHGLAAAEIRVQLRQDLRGHLLIDAAVLLEA